MNVTTGSSTLCKIECVVLSVLQLGKVYFIRRSHIAYEQQKYHTRKLNTFIFVSLFYPVITKTNILDNVAFNKDHHKHKSRADFMYSLAKEMVNYVDVNDIRNSKRIQAHTMSSMLSPTIVPSSWQHQLMEILPKSTKPDPNRHTTRSKYIYEWPLLYRHSGKNQQSKNGVGCQQIDGERVKTKLYCNICQAPVCADTKRHKNIVCLEKQCSVGTIYIVTRHWWVSLH